jgi:hypothetical protein
MQVERVFLLMEAWGYPRRGTDWLRRRRLLVIAVLATLSWVLVLAVCWTAYILMTQLAGSVGGVSVSAMKPSPPASSTPR